MSEQSNDIEKLIRLKRYEKPSDGYFEDFLTEFQDRQRSELLRRSARSLFFERVGTYFSGFSQRQWIYAGSAAYAAVTIGFFLIAGLNDGEETEALALAGIHSLAGADVPDAAPEQDNVLWDLGRRIVLVEEEPAGIAALQDLMSSKPEWDVLPTSTSTLHSVPFHVVPVKSSEGSPEARPVREF